MAKERRADNAERVARCSIIDECLPIGTDLARVLVAYFGSAVVAMADIRSAEALPLRMRWP
jgi:hypothetical protein